jgi:hypothetical protein
MGFGPPVDFFILSAAATGWYAGTQILDFFAVCG